MIETTIADGCVKVECDGKTIARCESDTDAERIKRALERESMVVVWFEATPEQDQAIEDVLDVADIRFAAKGGTRTDTLVSVLTDWRQRVIDDESAKIAAHLEKVDEEGPPGLDDSRTQMHLRLDDDDLRDIGAAVERRKAWDCEPDESDSCELGGMIAEICRGWMERVDHDKQAKSRRTDNCDGTVTFHGIDVTVRADVLEGRDVLAVRRPVSGDEYVGWYGIVVRFEHKWMTDEKVVRVIVGPKPQPPEPQFEAGKCYRAKAGGAIIGPIKGPNDMHAADWETLTSMLDPVEVIVWRHPGMRAGEYWWDGRLLKCGGMIVLNQLTSHHISSWTDPPRVGKWKVLEGQEYATWEGE